jgi:4-amino-4-deoxy-L-arabinose transferase-like glycosyltransferase
LRILFIFLLFLLLCVDIGNISGIRQGTEGFYLQISNEMFQGLNFLTPTYLGANHWSKPPLHFWLPFPFAFVFKNYLLAARVSILLFSFLSLAYISRWSEKYLRTDFFFTFTFFILSLGVFKYSRIFMMEMPLALLSTLATLTFYEFHKSKKQSYLLLSSLLLGLSVIIKGPVSFAYITAGVAVYSLFLNPENFSKKFFSFFTWSIIGLFIGSIWFILCYLSHGYEFIEYFFIRENVGKFTSKNYPVTSVIQGLFLYALPWSLFILPVFIRFKKFEFKNKTLYYILVNFSFAFFIWFLPKQKSHHYAIPSLPLFLLFLNYFIYSYGLLKNRTGKILLNSFYSILATFGLTLFLLASYFPLFKLSILHYLIFLLILLMTFALYKLKDDLLKALSCLVIMVSLWSFILPLFLLPTVPKAVTKIVNGPYSHKKIYVLFRKPFFIEQSLKKEIEAVSPGAMYKLLQEKDALFILPEDSFIKSKLKDDYHTLHKWPLWKRGIKISEVISSLKSSKLAPLQQKLILLSRKSLD